MNSGDVISDQLETGANAGQPSRVEGRRYEAVLRLSEALSQCREPEDLTTILSAELRELLVFLQFYIVVYKENSDEVEWAVVGREKETRLLHTRMYQFKSDHPGRRTRPRSRSTSVTGTPTRESPQT